MFRLLKTRRSYLLTALALGTALSSVIGAVGQAQALPFGGGGKTMSEMEEKTLEAETGADKEKSIQTLKSLLADIEKGKKPDNPAITAQYLRAAVVESYLTLFSKEFDVDHLEKAKSFILAAYNDPYEKAWAYAHMAGDVSASTAFKDDAAVKDVVEGLIGDAGLEPVADPMKKSRINYALATILTRTSDKKPVFTAQDMAQVHGLSAGILDTTSKKRVMHALALAGDGMEGLYPSSYAPLYALLKNEKVSTDDLVALQKKALEKDDLDLALTSLQMIEKQKKRTEHLFSLFEKMFEQGDIARARRIAERIENPAKGVDSWSLLGGHYLIEGYDAQSKEAYAKAESFVARIDREESRLKAQKLIDDRRARDTEKAEKKSESLGAEDQKRADNALKIFESEGVIPAVTIARTIEDTIGRVKIFRKIAELQTARNDRYGILAHNKAGESGSYRLDTAKDDRLSLASVEDTRAYEKITAEAMNDKPEGVIIRKGSESSIGKELPEEPLIARLEATGESIRAMIPLPDFAKIEISYYENNIFSQKFQEVYGNAGFVMQQGTTAPEVIVIEKGRADLPMIYETLKTRGYGDYMRRDGDVYTLYRPIVVGPKATLIITGDDVKTLRLSTQSGAFIANAGHLYMFASRLVGWNDAKNEPMWAEYKDKRNFRPFLTNWSQSKTYIGNSEIVALGYGNGKSYGFSMSAGPNKWFKLGNDPASQRPTGIVANNSFDNTLYGFYSYEADDAVLTGNEYVDNIVYGVDPHDRSRRLAIGYNTAYGTHKKHGIIISREVNNSLIFGNVTFENKGTGIMLDRDSNGTFVYGNTSFHNAQEGMTIFESDCAMIAANRMFENKGAGFRIRNSYNIGLYYNDIAHNKATGVSMYSATLKGDPVHQHRDFALDPYDELTGVTAVGNTIKANGSGIMADAVTGLFLKDNNFIAQSPKILRGSLFSDNPELLFRYDQKKYGLSINRTCPVLPEILYVQGCRFRDNGALRGDGLDHLSERIQASACAHSITDQKEAPAHGEENDDEE
ncbi:MAG: right-handed parallel beta-helix repeat-containing protein [Alphaproteobacteria bacterium]|nr:right-handed parallel beta-helix repeat-containing protein [Alphaproteobacteria bacterium]